MPFRVLKRVVDMNDVHAYGGAALAGFGIWLLEPAYAYIAVGAFLVYLGIRK